MKSYSEIAEETNTGIEDVRVASFSPPNVKHPAVSNTTTSQTLQATTSTKTPPDTVEKESNSKHGGKYATTTAKDTTPDAPAKKPSSTP